MTSLPLLLALTGATAPAPYAPPPSAPAPAPAPVEVEKNEAAPAQTDRLAGPRADSGMDQAFLAPTAFTQPATSVTLHDHQLAVLGATLALLERWQITVVAVPIILENGGLFGISTKLRLLDAGRFHLAIFGGAAKILDGSLVEAGAAASVCLDEGCGKVLSAYGLAGPQKEQVEFFSSHSTAVAWGASAILPLGQHLKLIGEVDVAGHEGCETYCESNAFEAILAFAGLRYHTGGFSLTFGAVAGVESSIYQDVVGMGPTATLGAKNRHFDFSGVLPGGSLSYRFGGS